MKSETPIDAADQQASAGTQVDLPLPFPELSGDEPLIPARMVNEYQYCPRLAYLEWVQGECAESADTAESRHSHPRVDKPAGDLPAPDDAVAGERIHARSITLSSSCSLVGICLPDEVNFFRREDLAPRSADPGERDFLGEKPRPH